MSQPINWGVPRTDGGNEYTPEQFAERADESFDALLSLHKGPSRPSYAEAGTLWLDDNSTPWTLKLFDGSDDIAIGTVNPSDNKFTPARAVLYEAQTLNSEQQAQARANIGTVLQSSATDTTAGRVLTVGAFGIGGRLDLRDTIYEQGAPQDVYGHGNVSGFARGGTDGLQIPGLGTNAYGGLTVSASYTDSSGIKAFYRQFVSEGRMWVQRAASATAWGEWKEVLFSGGSMPVGSTYIQMPGEATPSSLFGGTWTLLFNTEGVFFRTEGGNASAFGSGIQADELKSHTHSGSTNSAGAHTHNVSTVSGTSGGASGAQSGNGVLGQISTSSAGAHSHTVSINATGGAETRPRNRTVRVWKRTA